MSRPTVFRLATPSDAEALVEVHYAAVHAIPAEYYSDDIKGAWSRAPDAARHDRIRQVIARGEEWVVVAEENFKIVGFGILNPTSFELKALYVNPLLCGQGIGRALLQDLESRATALGMQRLRLNASLNAEQFYQRNGYRSLTRDTFPLSADHKMACVKMEKDL